MTVLHRFYCTFSFIDNSCTVTFMYLCVFQDNQKDLEHATEQLSEYLERDITSDMLADIKQKVQDKYRWELMSLHGP